MGRMDKIWEEVFVGQKQQQQEAVQEPRQQMSFAPSSMPRPIFKGPHLKIDESSSMDFSNSPTSNLDRSDSNSSPSPSPREQPPDKDGRRKSSVYPESQSVRPAVNQGINITTTSAPKRLDSSRSLPTGFRYIPELISPGSRKGESVWRSVFDPGSNKVLDRMGSSKFDKADPKGPSVYDWYNPLNI